jgi:hypothetical protein
MIDGHVALQKAEPRRAVDRGIVRSCVECSCRRKKKDQGQSGTQTSTQIPAPPAWRRERAHKTPELNDTGY